MFRGLGVFMMGVVVGGLLTFGSLKYHLVRADDGLHLVPKLSAQFGEAYVDIRGFGLTDWEQHRTLAVALTQANMGHLIYKDAAHETFRQSVEGVLDALGKRAS